MSYFCSRKKQKPKQFEFVPCRGGPRGKLKMASRKGEGKEGLLGVVCSNQSYVWLVVAPKKHFLWSPGHHRLTQTKAVKKFFHVATLLRSSSLWLLSPSSSPPPPMPTLPSVINYGWRKARLLEGSRSRSLKVRQVVFSDIVIFFGTHK